jgi:hypothetical protein
MFLKENPSIETTLNPFFILPNSSFNGTVNSIVNIMGLDFLNAFYPLSMAVFFYT